MKVKKTIWRPLAFGLIMGLLAGIATVTGLTFLTPGITDNAIGFFVTLYLLAAALGGPLAGAIAPAIFVIISTLFGPPEMQAVLREPITFWSNLLALSITAAMVGYAYRWVFERVDMPVRLLAWAGLILAYYFFSIPSSVIPQYVLSGEPTSEILPAVLYGFEIYYPQAIFDIFITSLVFIALPARYRKPLWIEPMQTPDLSAEVQNKLKAGAQ